MKVRALAIVAVALAGAVGTTFAEAHDRATCTSPWPSASRHSAGCSRFTTSASSAGPSPASIATTTASQPLRPVYNPRWDRDGDGIPNRYDRLYNPAWDRDGDGIPTATTGSTICAMIATVTASPTGSIGATTGAYATGLRPLTPGSGDRRSAAGPTPVWPGSSRARCPRRRPRVARLSTPIARAATMPNRARVARPLAALACLGLALLARQTLSPRKAAAPARPPAGSVAKPAVAAPTDASQTGLAARRRRDRQPLPVAGEELRLRGALGRDRRTPAAALVRADQPVQLASTAKLVTSLAAARPARPQHRWRTTAYSTAPGERRPAARRPGAQRRPGRPHRQRAAPLVRAAAPGRPADDLRQHRPRQRRPAARSRPEAGQGTEDERALDLPLDARTYNQGKLVVSVRPTSGERAAVSVKPRPANVLVVNDVLMGGACSAWAAWKRPEEIKSGPALQLWVRGRWKADCPARTSPTSGRRRRAAAARPGATTAPPIPAPRMVAELFAETGGSLRGIVIERDAAAPRPRQARR
jgi:hypothetical protein